MTPNTTIIIIPDGGTEQVLPTTFISLTEVSAMFPNSLVTGHNIHDVYLETEGLRSQRMRQVCVTYAPAHLFLDPTSVAAGGPVFSLIVSFTKETSYSINSGGIGNKVAVDGVDTTSLTFVVPEGIRFDNVTPDAVPGTHEVTVRLTEMVAGGSIPPGAAAIPSHDPPMIFTYT